MPVPFPTDPDSGRDPKMRDVESTTLPHTPYRSSQRTKCGATAGLPPSRQRREGGGRPSKGPPPPCAQQGGGRGGQGVAKGRPAFGGPAGGGATRGPKPSGTFPRCQGLWLIVIVLHCQLEKIPLDVQEMGTLVHITVIIPLSILLQAHSLSFRGAEGD